MKIEEKVQKCKFSRFCDSFGEWKCVKLERRINIEVDCLGCKLCKKGKKRPDELCHCDVCVLRDALTEAGDFYTQQYCNAMDELNEITRRTGNKRDCEK